MNITTRHDDDVTTVALDGRFDAHEVGPFRSGMDAVCAAGGVVRLDLAAVRFIDSTALAELLRVRRTLEEGGGQLRLAPISDPVRVILELTGLDSVFATLVGSGPDQGGAV